VGLTPTAGTFDITINRRRATSALIPPPTEIKCPRCETFKARDWTFHPTKKDGRATNRRLCLDCGITTMLQTVRSEEGW
jgi:hypothetical protein